MSFRNMFKPGWLISIVLTIVLLVSVACGADATPSPQPTPTPIDIAAFQSAIADAVKAAVPEAPKGVSAAEISKLVETAVKESIPDIPEGVTAAQVEQLVKAAIAESQSDGLSAADVENIVKAALPTTAPTPISAPAMVGRPGGVPKLQMGWSVGGWGVHECSSSNNCLTPTAPMYNQLIEYNPETADFGDIRGDLAKSWKIGADGVTYTFVLADNAKWHDGTSVSADDVVFSLDSMTDPDKPRPNASRIAAFYDKSVAIDSKTIEVTTKFKAAPFLPFLATEWMKILPKHRFERLTPDEAKLEENILGSGPFMLAKHDKDVVVEYRKNPNYFKEGRPYFDGMEYFTIVDTSAIFAAFKAGQVLSHAHPSSNLSNADNEKLAQDMRGRGTVHFAGPIGIIWTHMNTNKAPFDNPMVRKALFLAIDRQEMIQIFSNGRDQLGAPFQPGTTYGLTVEEIAELPGYRQLDGKKHPDDIAEAKKLLAEAGIAEGTTMHLQALQVVEFPDLAIVVADQLRRFLDLNIVVDNIALGAGFGKVIAGDYEMNILGYGPMITDPHDIIGGAYASTGRNNFSKWSHPRIEEIFEIQAKELDVPKRQAMIKEVQDIILSGESPFLTHYWTMRGMYVDDRLRNYNPPPTDSHALKMEHMWCDPGC